MPNKKKNNNNNNSSVARAVSRLAGFPGTYLSQPTLTRRFRYQTSSATFSTICRNAMLTMMVTSTNAGATTAAAVFSAVRLKYIELWDSNNGGLGLSATTGVKWLSLNGPDSEITATGNADHPAHIRSAPPAFSAARLWSLANQAETESLMVIICASGTIIDVEVEFVMQDSSTACTLGISALGTIGVVGVADLDCLTSGQVTGTQTIRPISVNRAVLTSRTPANP